MKLYFRALLISLPTLASLVAGFAIPESGLVVRQSGGGNGTGGGTSSGTTTPSTSFASGGGGNNGSSDPQSSLSMPLVLYSYLFA